MKIKRKPSEGNFLLRFKDPEMWKMFKAKCAYEGVTMNQKIEELITKDVKKFKISN